MCFLVEKFNFFAILIVKLSFKYQKIKFFKSNMRLQYHPKRMPQKIITNLSVNMTLTHGLLLKKLQLFNLLGQNGRRGRIAHITARSLFQKKRETPS